MSEAEPFEVAISCSSADYVAAKILRLLLLERLGVPIFLYELDGYAGDKLSDDLTRIYTEAKTMVAIRGELAPSHAVALEQSIFSERKRNETRSTSTGCVHDARQPVQTANESENGSSPRVHGQKRSVMILLGNAVQPPMDLPRDFAQLPIPEDDWFSRADRLRGFVNDYWPQDHSNPKLPLAVRRHLAATLDEHFEPYDPACETDVQCGVHGAATLFGVYQQRERADSIIVLMDQLLEILYAAAHRNSRIALCDTRLLPIFAKAREMLSVLCDGKLKKWVPAGKSKKEILACDLVLLLRFQAYLDYHEVVVDNYRHFFVKLGWLLDQNPTCQIDEMGIDAVVGCLEDTNAIVTQLKKKFASSSKVLLPENANLKHLSDLTSKELFPRIRSKRRDRATDVH